MNLTTVLLTVIAVVCWTQRGALADDAALNEKLVTAAYNGDFDTVRQLLSAGAEINAAGDPYFSALSSATFTGHDEIAAWLIGQGARISTAGGTRGTTLMTAASAHCLGTLRLLLQRGVRTNTKDWKGWTALMRAAHKNDLEAVRLLAEHHGTRLNLRNWGGATALHIAVRSNAVEVVQYLLRRGADPAIRDDAGATPFDTARYQTSTTWEGKSSVARARESMALLKPAKPK